MTEVLHSPSHFPSSPRTTNPTSPPAPPSTPIKGVGSDSEEESNDFEVNEGDPEEELVKQREKNQRDQLSLLAFLITLFRKSLVACKSDRRELCAMEIGWPTNVRHVAHVTFDRFNGFLGLPVELEPEVPRRPPSASATVFGVSTESMQLSYDTRGNCVPTILLLMQRRLYAQAGLQAEGIFRINAENSQEEYVRDQLNSGVVPEGIDVHCLAGLIKAWFRELPTGVLDSLSPEHVMQAQSEEDCAQLARCLPPTEAALLDWAINLMADVVEQEHVNKMNAHNIAMVFAPNMTQMADPLTALMYAVQVMNFLKTLILRTLRVREDSMVEPTCASSLEPFDENGHQGPSHSCAEDAEELNEMTDQAFVAEEPVVESSCNSSHNSALPNGDDCNSSANLEKLTATRYYSCEVAAEVDIFISETDVAVNSLQVSAKAVAGKNKIGQSSSSSPRKVSGKMIRQKSVLNITAPVEKTRGISNLSRVNSRAERIEAWR